MSAHTPGPWACLDDKSMGNEHHYQVVNSDGAPLFDSINRSPAADDATERADMVMAAAATEMFAALIIAREFISTDRNVLAECCTDSDGVMDDIDAAAVADYDAALLQIEAAIAKATASNPT